MKQRWWLIAAATVPVTALALAAPAAASQPGRAPLPRPVVAQALARVPPPPGFPAGRQWPAGQPATATHMAPGSPWRAPRAPGAIGRNGGLIAVSCVRPAACTAVGEHQTSGSTGGTLAEAWNGTRWRIQATPNPAGAADSFFTGVSCTSPSACTAVGIAFNSRGGFAPLAERWNGKAWLIQATPIPAGAGNANLSGVSCTSASACFAVGGFVTSTGRSFDLAERWNGTRWHIQAIPSPPGSAFKGLSWVSCSSARACTAVGSFVSGGPLLTLAERWNGTRWHIQATPNPPRRSAQLFGVSCSSARACTATGISINSAQTLFPLAEGWNGTSWHIQPTPTPAGFAFFAPLPSVSCTSASACTAAGSWDNRAGDEFTLAERWNGTRWHIQATPNPAGTTASAFEGVSCPSPSTCTAVGTFGPPGVPGRTLAERWNGTRWHIQPTPNPAG